MIYELIARYCVIVFAIYHQYNNIWFCDKTNKLTVKMNENDFFVMGTREELRNVRINHFFDILSRLSPLVTEMYERLQNSVIHISREFDVYIINEEEDEYTLFCGSELENPNNRTDYYEIYVHRKNIADYDMPIYLDNEDNYFHYSNEITNYVNSEEDIRNAKYMLRDIAFIQNTMPDFVNANNSQDLVDMLSNKMRFIEQNEVDEDNFIIWDDDRY